MSTGRLIVVPILSLFGAAWPATGQSTGGPPWVPPPLRVGAPPDGAAPTSVPVTELCLGDDPLKPGSAQEPAAVEVTLESLGTIKLSKPGSRTPPLRAIERLAMGPGGRLYAVDHHAAGVHVFDPSGVHTGVLRLDPRDFPPGCRVDHLAVAGDGSVWLRTRERTRSGESSYAGVAADGPRQEPKPCRLSRSLERWYFQPGGANRWVISRDTVWLVDGSDRVIKTIGHPTSVEGRAGLDYGAVAADGSLAVVASPRGAGMHGPVELNIYSPEGTLRKTIRLPDGYRATRVALSGKWAATTRGAEVNLYEVQAQRRLRFMVAPEGAGEQYWYPLMSPDGRELLLFRPGTLTLHRFKLPT